MTLLTIFEYMEEYHFQNFENTQEAWAAFRRLKNPPVSVGTRKSGRRVIEIDLTEVVTSRQLADLTGIEISIVSRHALSIEGTKLTTIGNYERYLIPKAAGLAWAERRLAHPLTGKSRPKTKGVTVRRAKKTSRTKGVSITRRKKKANNAAKGKRKHTEWRSTSKDDEIRDELPDSPTQSDIDANQHDERNSEDASFDWSASVGR